MTTGSSAARTRPAVDRLVDVADLALGASMAAARWATRGGRFGARAMAPVAPVARLALRPPRVDERYWPESMLHALAERGREERTAVAVAVTRMALALVPEVLDAALDQVDLTTLVIDRVELDEVVANVDLDEAAARIDIQAILDRVDLIGLARVIIDGVDLPEIIRGSTGSMASDGIRGVREQTMDADEWVSRVVDRMLLRRHGRHTDTTFASVVESGSNGADPA